MAEPGEAPRAAQQPAADEVLLDEDEWAVVVEVAEGAIQEVQSDIAAPQPPQVDVQEVTATVANDAPLLQPPQVAVQDVTATAADDAPSPPTPLVDVREVTAIAAGDAPSQKPPQGAVEEVTATAADDAPSPLTAQAGTAIAADDAPTQQPTQVANLDVTAIAAADAPSAPTPLVTPLADAVQEVRTDAVSSEDVEEVVRGEVGQVQTGTGIDTRAFGCMRHQLKLAGNLHFLPAINVGGRTTEETGAKV